MIVSYTRASAANDPGCGGPRPPAAAVDSTRRGRCAEHSTPRSCPPGRRPGSDRRARSPTRPVPPPDLIHTPAAAPRGPARNVAPGSAAPPQPPVRCSRETGNPAQQPFVPPSRPPITVWRFQLPLKRTPRCGDRSAWRALPREAPSRALRRRPACPGGGPRGTDRPPRRRAPMPLGFRTPGPARRSARPASPGERVPCTCRRTDSAGTCCGWAPRRFDSPRRGSSASAGVGARHPPPSSMTRPELGGASSWRSEIGRTLASRSCPKTEAGTRSQSRTMAPAAPAYLETVAAFVVRFRDALENATGPRQVGKVVRAGEVRTRWSCPRRRVGRTVRPRARPGCRGASSSGGRRDRGCP